MSVKSKANCLTIGAMVLVLASLGCNSSVAENSEARSLKTAAALTEADVAALEKGLSRESALVLAARERGTNARTPEERGKAAQDEWEERTIPGGAQAAGLSVERYREVRQAVNHVLETLDFQGKIDGPLEIDLEHADPQMKQRLISDPLNDLSSSSAAALRARMKTIVPVWIHYMQLTALNG
jgi:hypothetical protein